LCGAARDPAADCFQTAFLNVDSSVGAATHNSPRRVLLITTRGLANMRKLNQKPAHYSRLIGCIFDNQTGDCGASILTLELTDQLRPGDFCGRPSGKCFERRWWELFRLTLLPNS